MTEPEPEKLECGKSCVVEQIKEIYQKAIDADKEMLKKKPQTEEEFKQSLAKAVAERAKLDPNVSYDTFKEEVIEIFKSEDQYSTFISCCEYMMETNATIGYIIQLILNVINYLKHSPAYKLSLELQSLPFNRDDNDMDLEGSFYDEIIKNDPKEQQRNKKKLKKKKVKKNAAAAAAEDETAEPETTEEFDDNIPKLEEILQRIDFSDVIVVPPDGSIPSLPTVSPEEKNIGGKVQTISDILKAEIVEIVSLISETSMEQQTAVLTRELAYLEKKATANTAFYEKREAEIKANIKELLAKTEVESREQHRLENQIHTLEAEIEKVEQRKEDIVKRIEKVDDTVFIKYKTQWQNTMKRFHELEEEVKNVSFSIRREKQSFTDLSITAKKEDDALKKEIEALEATVERKQAQLDSCEARLEAENQKHEEERQKLLTNIQTSEALVIRSMYEKEKLHLGRKFTKAQENSSCYRKALEQEDDQCRREILAKNLDQWETYKAQIRSSKQILDTMFAEKIEKFEKGANFYDIHGQYDYPQFHASGTPFHDLILPAKEKSAGMPPSFSHSNYITPQHHHQHPHFVTPTFQHQQLPHFVTSTYQHHHHQQPQLLQQHPQSFQQGFRYPPSVQHSNVYPPENNMDQNSNISNQSSRQNSNESIKEDGTASTTSAATTPKIPFRAHYHYCGGRYPIGVIPPYYVKQIQDDKNTWTPPPEVQEHVFKFPPNYDLLGGL